MDGLEAVVLDCLGLVDFVPDEPPMVRELLDASELIVARDEWLGGRSVVDVAIVRELDDFLTSISKD